MAGRLMADGAVTTETVMSEVKHIRRVISEHGIGENDSEPLPVIEAYINSYLKDGWKLFQVFYMGHVPEGLDYLWILVR